MGCHGNGTPLFESFVPIADVIFDRLIEYVGKVLKMVLNSDHPMRYSFPGIPVDCGYVVVMVLWKGSPRANIDKVFFCNAYNFKL